MNRRTFLKNIGITTAALSFSSCQKSTQNKPNIVFIFIDDLGWKDTGYMGSDYYETPNIDKISQQGMIFTNAYSNAANCAPTRASLLTGQYSPRHGVYTVASSSRGDSKNRRLIPIENSREVELDKITIAEALKNTDYVSAAIGKWNIGLTPEQQGFDFDIDREELDIKGHFSENGEYLTDLLTDESRDPLFRTRPVSVIRKRDWKLLMFHEEWVLDGGRKNMEENNSIELYNLKDDIAEQNNLAQINTMKRDELLTELLDWLKNTKAPVPTIPNPEYIDKNN